MHAPGLSRSSPNRALIRRPGCLQSLVIWRGGTVKSRMKSITSITSSHGVATSRRPFFSTRTLVSRLVILHMESPEMTSERLGDIYLTLTRIVILNRCHHLLKEQISSAPYPQAPTRRQAHPPPSSPLYALSSRPNGSFLSISHTAR